MHAGASEALSARLGGRQAAARGRAASGAAGLTTTGSTELFLQPTIHRAGSSRSALRVHAFAQGCRFGGPDDGTYERVLRYPNGDVRRIRYPLPPSVEPSAEDLTDGCWANTCWEPHEQHWGGPPVRSGKQGGTATAERTCSAAASPPADFLPQPLPTEPECTRLPSSPMELLRYLNSPEYKQSQEQLWTKVRGSYEVLSEVPWVAPKPLYLLAQQQQPQPQRGLGEPAPGLTYSLRARVARADQEAELSRVLKRHAPDGSPLIRCSEMKDGVLAFEDEEDAERYRQMLEAEGSAEVSIVHCDSHDLFCTVQDLQGVVVLLRRSSAFLPQLHQLSTSLRSQPGAGAGSEEPLFD